MNTLDVSDKARELMLSQFFMSLLLKGQFSFLQIIKSLRFAKKVLDKNMEQEYRELYKTKYTH